MADEPPDRLSQLPDELLQRILELAPCREAESTAVLSRRWRGIWPPPAVKIEIPSVDSDGFHRRRRDAALRGAKEALAAAQGPVKSLSIHVGDECEFVDIVVGEVLSYRASSRGVQDLRIVADDSSRNAIYNRSNRYNDDDDTSWSWPPDVRRVYLHLLDFYSSGDDTCKMFWNLLKNFGGTKFMKLNVKWPIDDVAALEWETIFRELLGETMFDVEHLEIDARHKPTSKDAAVAIGNLLQCCPVIGDLRIKLKIANRWRPRGRRKSCNTLVQNKAQKEFHKSIDRFKRRRDRPVIPLRGDDDKVGIVSDIPGLSDRWQHFGCLRYHLRRSSLQFLQMGKPDCVGIQLAKLFVERGMALEEMYIDDGNTRLWEHMNCRISGYAASPRPCSELHVLARMSTALSMNQFSSSKICGWSHHRKLEVRRTHPWSSMRRLFQCLHENVGEGIGNLLQCCPSAHDLRLKLTTADPQPWRRKKRKRSTSLQSKAQLEFHKSIDHFSRRRDNTDTVVPPLCRDDGKFEVSDIDGLSDRWFHLSCLQHHLKRLSLQFHMDKDNPNCIGVQLIKFFVERGMALEEMYIDDGNVKLWEHMNCKISRYAANPEPFPEYHVLQRMSQALSMNQFSSSKISGWFQSHK